MFIKPAKTVQGHRKNPNFTKSIKNIISGIAKNLDFSQSEILHFTLFTQNDTLGFVILGRTVLNNTLGFIILGRTVLNDTLGFVILRRTVLNDTSGFVILRRTVLTVLAKDLYVYKTCKDCPGSLKKH